MSKPCVVFLGLALVAMSSCRLLAAPPAEPRILDIVPHDGSDVPLHPRIAVFANIEPASISFSRIHDDGSREVLRADTRVPSVFLLDPGALIAGEDLVIEPACSTCNGTVTFHVTSVDDVTPPIWAANAVLAPGTATDFTDGNPIFPQRKGYEIGFEIPRVTDDSGPVFIDFKPDEGPETFEPAGATGDGPNQANDGIDAVNSGIHFFLDGPDERTVCADVVAVDVAGNQTPFPTRACVALKHTAEGAGLAGCASERTSSSWALLVVAAAVGLRSRARRASTCPAISDRLRARRSARSSSTSVGLGC